MFNEIATLIYTQGELIDNIEKNMSQTTNYVETAKKETEKAVVYQSKARRVRL
jgi:t-SNARE complex subunit (syntaxin)